MHDPGDEDLPPPVAAPPPPAASWFSRSAARTACAFATRYGGPVYLVGSALREERPGDFDVRLVLDERDLVRLFGERRIVQERWWDWTEQDQRRGREQLKQSRRLSRRFRCNVDFQFQSKLEAERYAGPKLRLDTVPAATFEVGWTDA